VYLIAYFLLKMNPIKKQITIVTPLLYRAHPFEQHTLCSLSIIFYKHFQMLIPIILIYIVN